MSKIARLFHTQDKCIATTKVKKCGNVQKRLSLNRYVTYRRNGNAVTQLVLLHISSFHAQIQYCDFSNHQQSFLFV